MRAWLTIDGVKFAADEWPAEDARDAVFSARLRPVGTRPPGLEWWFSEGVWKGDNPAPEYLVKVDLVEIDQGGGTGAWCIEKERFGEPLWGHPGELRRIKTTDGRFLTKSLDADRQRFGGYGKESFILSTEEGNSARAELMPPFFNQEASFNKKDANRHTSPPSPGERHADDLDTFIRFLIPGKGEGPGAGMVKKGGGQRPRPQSWEIFRNKWKMWTGSFEKLAQEVAAEEKRNREAFEQEMAKWKRRRRILWWLLGLLVTLGLVLWGLWTLDGRQAATVRKLTQEEKFEAANRTGTGFFVFRRQLDSALKANANKQREWMEGKQEAYEDAIREGRWLEALALGEQMAGGGGKKPGNWGDVTNLLNVLEAKTTADGVFQQARKSGSSVAAKEAADAYRQCLSLVYDALSDLDPELKRDIQQAQARAEAWDVQTEMGEHERAGRWAEAKTLAEQLLECEGAAQDGRDAARQVLEKCRGVDNRLQRLGTMTNDPAAYFIELESLGQAYGEETVISRLAADGGNAFGTAMKKLLARAIQSARKGGNIPSGLEREVHWVETAERGGVGGLELLLGWLRYYGVGCNPDPEISARHFGRAADEEKSGQGAFMLGVIRASQDNREAAVAAMKKAEGKGVREAAVVLSGRGQSLIPETLRAAATNLPCLRTAVALEWVKRGRRAEGVDLLRKTVNEGEHYPPAELWLSAMVGASEPEATTYYQRNLAPGVARDYPRPFKVYPAVLSPSAELSQYESDTYIVEELLARGTETPARLAALEGALERGDLRMTGILLSSGILSELSPADAAAVLATALGDGETNDLLWCSLRVVTEHWDEGRKNGVLGALQGSPEVIRTKIRQLLGIAKAEPAGNRQRSRWSWW